MIDFVVRTARKEKTNKIIMTSKPIKTLTVMSKTTNKNVYLKYY